MIAGLDEAEKVEALAARGTQLQLQADPSAQRRTMKDAEAEPEGVLRTYSEEGGILDELMAQAAEHPEIAEFRVIGETVQGQEIGAVRVRGLRSIIISPLSGLIQAIVSPRRCTSPASFR